MLSLKCQRRLTPNTPQSRRKPPRRHRGNPCGSSARACRTLSRDCLVKGGPHLHICSAAKDAARHSSGDDRGRTTRSIATGPMIAKAPATVPGLREIMVPRRPGTPPYRINCAPSSTAQYVTSSTRPATAPAASTATSKDPRHERAVRHWRLRPLGQEVAAAPGPETLAGRAVQPRSCHRRSHSLTGKRPHGLFSNFSTPDDRPSSRPVPLGWLRRAG